MARFTSVIIACAIALVSVSAQDIQTSTCEINTPDGSLQVGKPYTVTFKNCNGADKDVKLRYGLPEDLKTYGKHACTRVNMSSGFCTFTPTEEGKFAFSAEQDGAPEESYSAFFTVAPAPEAKGPVPDGKGSQPVAEMKPEAKGLPASPKGPTIPADKGPQPVADMKPKAKELPASPKGPAPASAGKKLQPMASEKPEVKMAPSFSKAEAVRKANTKRALYDIAAFAL